MKLYSIVLVAIIYACSSAPVKEKELANEVKTLAVHDIFAGDRVASFLMANKIVNPKSSELFLEAIDLFRNKKELDSSIVKFQESILSYPTANSYYELGNVWMSKKDYNNALLAFEMAEKLGYEPFAKVMYNKACLYSLTDQEELAGEYLEYALQAGYSNIININRDKDLAKLRESYYFQRSLSNGLSGMSNPENLYWIQFKRQFPTVKLPLTIDVNNAKKIVFTDKSRIAYDFEKYIAEMRDDKFSRDVGTSFMYYAQVKETSKYVAVIYTVRDEMYDSDRLDMPLMFRLAVYTHEGKLIDKKEIAGRILLDRLLKTCTISKDLNITINSYETEYQSPPEDAGYENNPIVSNTLKETKKFKIDANGKIVSVGAKVMNAEANN